MVTDADAAYATHTRTTARPQLAWESVTAPGRRSAWQSGVTDVIVHAKGDRRGVGATNHCMHGKDAVIEEILDWRPYDYLTDRSTMATPDGPVRFLTTVELEPTTDGTIIHTRFAAPTSARERAIVERLMPAFREVLAESDRGLSVQLDDEHRSRSAAPPDEPVLPAPGRGGPLDT